MEDNPWTRCCFQVFSCFWSLTKRGKKGKEKRENYAKESARLEHFPGIHFPPAALIKWIMPVVCMESVIVPGYKGKSKGLWKSEITV